MAHVHDGPHALPQDPAVSPAPRSVGFDAPWRWLAAGWHDLRATGVAFDTRQATEGPATARCLIVVTPDAQRTMNTYLGACTRLGPEDIDVKQVAAAAVTYVEGYGQSLDVLRAVDVGTARAAICATNDDLRNIEIALLIRELSSSVRVVVQTAATEPGIILPNESVVRTASGNEIVWEKVGPEHFVARQVSTRPLDSTRLSIVDGLDPNTSVVTSSARLLSQFR